MAQKQELGRFFLAQVDLDAKMNKQTQIISDTVNRIEKEKREEDFEKAREKLRRNARKSTLH